MECSVWCGLLWSVVWGSVDCYLWGGVVWSGVFCVGVVVWEYI